jgi:hypothetical protein
MNAAKSKALVALILAGKQKISRFAYCLLKQAGGFI